jgi:arsenate reductase
MKILFMCVANSARSQLAEGLAKNLFGPTFEIQSAGSQPSKLNPLAVEVMKELDIDISKQYSKSFDEISPKFVVSIDYVITLCAEEVCPVISTKAKKLHWPFPDPAGHESLSHEEQLARFRSARDAIKNKLAAFKVELQR